MEKSYLRQLLGLFRGCVTIDEGYKIDVRGNEVADMGRWGIAG